MHELQVITRRRLRPVRLLAAMLIALLLPAAPSPLGPVPAAYAAGPIVVTPPAQGESLPDEVKSDSRCTLREAIIAANGNIASGGCPAGGFDPVIDLTGLRGTLQLQATLVIRTSMRLLGPGPDLLTISGGGDKRVFFIDGGLVRISGLTIANGRAHGGNGGEGFEAGGGGGGAAGLGGGMLINRGDVTLQEVRFRQNVAIGGNGGPGSPVGKDPGFSRGGGAGGIGQDGVGTDGESESLPVVEGAGGAGRDFGSDRVTGSGGSASEGAGGSGGLDGRAGGVGGFGGGGGGGGFDNAGGVGGFGAGSGGRGAEQGSILTSEVSSFGAGSRRGGAQGSSIPGGAFGGNGGAATSTAAGGGGGGAGLGGAIFVRSRRLILIKTEFIENEARGGTGGAAGDSSSDPALAGQNGQGLGAAVAFDAALILASEANPKVVNNRISGDPRQCRPGGNSDVCGSPKGDFRVVPQVGVEANGFPARTSAEGVLVNGSFVISSGAVIPRALTVPFQITDSVPFRKSVDGTVKSGYNISGPNLTLNPQADGSRVLTGTVTLTRAVPTVTLTIAPTDDVPVSDRLVISLDESQDDTYLLDEANQAGLTIRADPSPAWLVLLYVAADDATPALNRDEANKAATRVVSLSEPASDLLGRLGDPRITRPNPDMRLVVLFDGNGVGDSEIYVREPGGDTLTPVVPTVNWPGYPADRELNTGDAGTLRKFIRWARIEYAGSARTRTVLSIVDHGGGWAPDLGNALGQPVANPRDQPGNGRGMSLDDKTQFSLSTRNTGEVFKQLGDLGHVDVLFFDACLMGMIESMYEVKDYAKYVIAGQNLLWAEFPYERYLAPDILNAQTGPDDLAKAIVKLYNPDQPNYRPNPYTIAAVDTGRLKSLRDKTERLAETLLNHTGSQDRPAIFSAYGTAQKFDYDANRKIDDKREGYVDLYSFAEELQKSFGGGASDVDAAAEGVKAEIGLCTPTNGAEQYCEPGAAVIALKRVSGLAEPTPSAGNLINPTWQLDRAHGISIYLPLGEQDCRPTGRPLEPNTEQHKDLVCRYANNDIDKVTGNRYDAKHPKAKKGLVYERQLFYYTYTQTVQLQFTAENNMLSNWGKLLNKLEKYVPAQEPNREFESVYQGLPQRPRPVPPTPPWWLHLIPIPIWLVPVALIGLLLLGLLLCRWSRGSTA